MKNELYMNSIVDVAKYLLQRENIFSVNLTTDDVIIRTEVESGYSYRMLLDRVVISTGYRINLFPEMDKVQIVLPERKYRVFMVYENNRKAITSFDFVIPQTILDFDFKFDQYTAAFDEAAIIIDEHISNQIINDIHYCIFDELVHSESNRGPAWKLQALGTLNIDISTLYNFS